MGSDGPSSSSRTVSTMEGRVDSYFTRDGVTWYRTNYQQGGQGQILSLWTSSDWATFTTGGVTSFHGIWGHTLLVSSGNSTASNTAVSIR